MKATKAISFIMAALVCLSMIPIFSGCEEKTEAESNTKIQVEMENGGTFIIELYPEYAPDTVKNFVKLVEEKFYDGLTFHRIVDGFMAQGGGFYRDENNSDVKKDADKIKGEFSKNGFTQNTLKHTKGVISMARLSGQNDSASSEFFIMLGTHKGLDGDYAAFGKVIEGMEIVEKFQELERVPWGMDDNASPVEPLIIKKMTVME